MGLTTEGYLSKLKENRGKLEKWEKEIFTLFHANISYQKICDFLEANNVTSTRMEIYNFIHRKKRRNLMEVKRTNNNMSENKGSDCTVPAAPNQGVRLPSQKSNQESHDTALPKFSWQHRPKDEDPNW